jgi:putative membrane protein
VEALEDRAVPDATGMMNPLISVKEMAKVGLAPQTMTVQSFTNGPVALSTAQRAAANLAEAQSDEQFLFDALQGDQQEMILGALALTRGQGLGVRLFGLRLVTDHARMFANAMPVVISHGLTVPQISADMLQQIQQIASLQGTAFDRAFLDYMVQDHQREVQNFRNEISQGTDPQIRTLARTGLPLIRQHLFIAQFLQRVRGGPGSGDNQSTAGVSDTASATDTQFLLDALKGAQQEIILGALAMVQGRGIGVRNFGLRLVVDHARMFANAMPLLSGAGQTLEPPTTDQMQRIQDIASQRGTAFDRAFVNSMVEDHQKDAQSFMDEIAHGTDPQIKAYAQQGLPIIIQHWATALILQQRQSQT